MRRLQLSFCLCSRFVLVAEAAGVETALKHTIHLNHKYALDGCDPSSYGGILWCYGEFDGPKGGFSAISDTVMPGLSNPVLATDVSVLLQDLKAHPFLVASGTGPRTSCPGNSMLPAFVTWLWMALQLPGQLLRRAIQSRTSAHFLRRQDIKQSTHQVRLQRLCALHCPQCVVQPQELSSFCRCSGRWPFEEHRREWRR